MFGHAIMLILAYTAQFFFCEAALVNTSDNLFNIILQFFTFTSCMELPVFASVILFVLLPLPWLIYAVSLLIPLISGLLSNTVVGTIVGVGFAVTLVTLLVTYFI